MFEKWVPSFPIRQPDQIVSVKVKMKSFLPSYERVGENTNSLININYHYY